MRRTKNWSSEYGSILLVTIGTFMGFYCPQPLLVSIAAQSNVSQPAASLLITVTIFPFALAPFLYGRLLVRFSLHTILMASLAGSGASLCFAGLAAPHYPLMLAARLLQGMLIPGILLCLTSRLSSMFSGRELQNNMAMYAAMTIIGAYGGRALSGLLGSLSSVNCALLGFGIIQLCTLLPARFIKEGSSEDTLGFSFHDIAQLLRNKHFLIVLLIGPVCIFGYSAVLNFFPFHISSIIQSDSSDIIGFIYAFGLINAFLASINSRIINIFHGEWKTLFAACLLFILLMPFFLGKSLLICAIIMLGTNTAFSIIYSNCTGIVNRVIPCNKVLINTLYLGIYYSFSALGSVLPLVIYSSFGLSCFILLILGIFVIDIILIILSSRHFSL